MKRCTACNTVKPFGCFSKRKASKDGLAYKCRQCDKIYRNLRGKEHYAKLRRKTYQRNREAEKLKALQSYYDNHEHAKARHAEYMERTAKQQRAYRSRVKHKIVANVAKRRAALHLRTPNWLNEKHLREIEDFYLEARLLSERTGEQYHVDHVVPLRGETVSGLHVPWNLQILKGCLNVSKANQWDGS